MGTRESVSALTVADRAVAWEDEGGEPSRFRDHGSPDGPPSLRLRHRAVYHRPIRSVVRAELASVRDLPIGHDEEE
jgi:hypothetical protein